MSRRGRQKKKGGGDRLLTRAESGDWSGMAARAERELARNRRQIDAAPRGTPGGKGNGWKLGEGPGTSRVDH